MTRFIWILEALAAIALASFWIIHTYTMPWMRDEGFYLYSTFLVKNHALLPYLDFSYPQAPLFPFLLRGWASVLPLGLFTARLFSAFFVFGIALLFYVSGRQANRSRAVIWAAITLFMTHPFVWNYFVIVKPHAITLFLSMVSIYFTWISIRTSNRRWHFITIFSAGFFLGIAGNIRLNLAVIAPLIVGSVWFLSQVHRSSRARLKTTALFALGLLVPTFVTFCFFYVDPVATKFYLFDFHGLRSAMSADKVWSQRWATIAYSARVPTSVLVIALAAAVSIRMPFRQRISSGSGRLALGFLVSGMIATIPFFLVPIFLDEYFGLLLVMVLAFVILWADRDKWLRWGSVAAIVLALGSWGPEGLKTVKRFGSPEQDSSPNTIYNVKRVGQRIQELSSPSDRILVMWEGYAFVGRRRVVDGTEHVWGIKLIEGRIDKRLATRVHMSTPEQMIREVLKKDISLIVVGIDTPKGFAMLVERNYRLLDEVGGAKLYGPHVKES